MADTNNNFVNDGSFLAMMLSGKTPKLPGAPPAPELPGGAAQAEGSQGGDGARQRKKRTFSEGPGPGQAPEAALNVTASAQVLEAVISERPTEESKADDDEEVMSEWGKMYKKGYVPKSSHVGNLLPEDDLKKYTSALPWNKGKSAEEKKAEEEKPKIDSSNIGHKLLAKMGWKEGKGLGAKEEGKVAPVAATDPNMTQRSGHLAGDVHGIGSQHTWDLDGDEDMFEKS